MSDSAEKILLNFIGFVISSGVGLLIVLSYQRVPWYIWLFSSILLAIFFYFIYHEARQKIRLNRSLRDLREAVKIYGKDWKFTKEIQRIEAEISRIKKGGRMNMYRFGLAVSTVASMCFALACLYIIVTSENNLSTKQFASFFAGGGCLSAIVFGAKFIDTFKLFI